MSSEKTWRFISRHRVQDKQQSRSQNTGAGQKSRNPNTNRQRHRIRSRDQVDGNRRKSIIRS
uniref:Uncharacterized protein n=1 Tax=Anguilla anguilla TaxID=7936 RepID=A0A0E9Y2R9_ANGAN